METIKADLCNTFNKYIIATTRQDKDKALDNYFNTIFNNREILLRDGNLKKILFDTLLEFVDSIEGLKIFNPNKYVELMFSLYNELDWFYIYDRCPMCKRKCVDLFVIPELTRLCEQCQDDYDNFIRDNEHGLLIS